MNENDKMNKTEEEIVRQGYQALVDALGIVDAIRFIKHFSPGKGDYTKERHQWLDQVTIEDFRNDVKENRTKQDILTLMKQYPEDDPDRYDEIIE